MTTPTDAGSAELVARLRRILMHPYLENGNVMERPEPINPDGSEAADRILALEPRIRELEEALGASAGYLRNAKIDLETGAPKATAIRTIEGGLKRVEDTFATLTQADERESE